MDWARDSLGNDVSSSQPELSSYGLYCPTCGEPVFRRAGELRRAHFAHKGHSAKPDCENYHPPLNSPTLSNKDNSSSNPLLGGGLFLECSEYGNYSLYLKLPCFFVEKESCGEIKIQTGLGIRTYTSLQLERSRLVKIVPQIPPVDVIATGCLSKAAADINAFVKCFRSFGNYFRAREPGGKLLATEEPLEWGEHYRLLTQQQLGPIPEIFGLRIETDKGWEGWHLYEVVLPPISDIQNQLETEILSRLLGRTIKAPHTHVYFIDPSHHIEQDGTYVFPETTKCIVLRRTEPKNISFNGSPQTVSKVMINYIDAEWVEITGIDIGYFSVLVEGREELLGKIEECDLFQPGGVRVVLDERTWEIFEPGLHEIIQHNAPENMHIECPNLRVADRLALGQDVWDRVNQSYILRKTGCHPVDAGNFGILTWPLVEGKVECEYPNIDLLTEARRIWLEGIVASYYGPNALLQLRKEWNSTKISGYSEIAISKLAWLSPHIYLVRRAIR